MSVPSLLSIARDIVAHADTGEKVRLAGIGAKAWFSGTLALKSPGDGGSMPDRPGRPSRPVLLAPRDMPKRSASGARGRVALVHSLAHIELNAVDLTWDLIGRFATQTMPRSFFDNFVQVGLEEAKHFDLLERRLAAYDARYGDLPAHDGLWQAAQETGHSLIARLAIVPLVLEARGLDVTPSMTEKMRKAGDDQTAAVMEIIYRDEKRHVAYGAKWFRFLCDRERVRPEPTFHTLVRRHFRGGLKPPFNDRARSEAGLTPGFYKPLVSFSPL